jgi:hypothetical protein
MNTFEQQQSINQLLDSLSHIFSANEIDAYTSNLDRYGPYEDDPYTASVNAILMAAHINLSVDPTNPTGPTDQDKYVAFYPPEEFIDIVYNDQVIPAGVQAGIDAGTISVTDIVKTSLEDGNLSTLPSLEKIQANGPDGASIILPDAGLTVLGLEDSQLDYITSMYIASFSRAPDADGLMYWGERAVSFMEDDGFDFGKTALTINKALYAAGEANNESGTKLDTGSFVESAYQSLLGRSSDEGGLKYWSENIDSGFVQRADFLTHFINAAFNSPGDSDQIDRLVTVSEFMALDNVSGPGVNIDNNLLDSVTDIQNDVDAGQMIVNIVNDYGQPDNQAVDIVGLQSAIDSAMFG